MDTNNIDRKNLKAVIREILIEDSSIFKNIIKEILEENKIIVSDDQLNRRQRIEKMIDSDFDKYDDVFKALA